MSKAVLLSIRPEWCEKIASGRKTIEVRKTRPKLETPFKCYIYQTHSGQKEGRLHSGVIGEFVCDKVFNIYEFSCSRFWLNEALLKDTCLSYDEIKKYAGNAKEIYGWHISELKIYDKPKELSEFHMPGTLSNEDYLSTIYDGSGDPMRSSYASYLFTRQLRRPPQSWCYVVELT